MTVAVSAMSGRYLEAVKAVAKRAQFNAKAAGRTEPNQRDIADAVLFDNGSETRLRAAIEASAHKPGRGRPKTSPAMVPVPKMMTSSTPAPSPSPAPARTPAVKPLAKLHDALN